MLSLLCQVCSIKTTQITEPQKPSNFKNYFNYFSVSVKRHHGQSDLCELVESLQFQRVGVNDGHGKEHGCRQAGRHVARAVVESLYLMYKQKTERARANWA